MMRITFILAAAFSLFLLSGALRGEGLSLSSPAFRDEGTIPIEHSCKSSDFSPELRWAYAGEVRSFALVCEDPDAPGGGFIHWVVYNIPAEARSLPRGFPKVAVKNGIAQGLNDFDATGYRGPCPPAGKPHRYVFHLYALDIVIAGSGLTGSDLKEKMRGHVLSHGRLTGLFGR